MLLALKNSSTRTGLVIHPDHKRPFAYISKGHFYIEVLEGEN